MTSILYVSIAENKLYEMERERAEVTQEVLLKAHVMASNSRRSPLKGRPSPTPPDSSAYLSTSNPNSEQSTRHEASMRVQDLAHHPRADNTNLPPTLIAELEHLHKQTLGQLRDVSHLVSLCA